MRKLLGTMLLTCIIHLAIGQTVKGRILDAHSKVPIPGASIRLGNQQAVSDESGNFQLTHPPSAGFFRISSLGYRSLQQSWRSGQENTVLTFYLEAEPIFLQPLEIRSIRASDKAPFTKTNLSAEQIAASNLGQDIPFLLDQTPSVVINADAGTGIGYTGIRIRGTDATRINVTLNGIPYNDAESLGTYFVDLPDFSSSLSSIQIQRGVGTSSNGAGAFGATLNLATNEFHDKAYAQTDNSFGSFNTWKNTLKAGTGLIGKHFTLDARLSRITSDGYIQRASSDLKSLYLSAAWLTSKSSLRFNLISGKEKTYQAWYGVPENLLSTDRTYNPAGTEKPGTPYDNQTDNYTQTHYQLFFNHSFDARWSLNTAVFLTRGIGYYEEYKAAQNFADYGLPDITQGGTTITQTDLVRRRWLDNYFYGQIASVQYKDKLNEWTFGGGWNVYDGKHYGTLPWVQTGPTPPASYRYYDYPALKTDINFYTKWQRQVNTYWTGFADLQYRYVSHTMTGFEGSPTLDISRKFNFINPKLGITYQQHGWKWYFSYALAHKEPNRDDFQASLSSQPKAETLHDVETGFERKGDRYKVGATAYYMYYYNQLVLTGQINDVGSYTRINIPYSYRLGLELEGTYTPADWMRLSGNLSLSRNKISSFTEYIDNYDNGGQNAVPHHNTDISFSPSVVGGADISFFPLKQLELSILNKYVGKEYMDNSQEETRKLNAFFVTHLRASYSLKHFLVGEWTLRAQVNNLFNTRYEPNGYTYAYIYNNTLTTENSYYPMAGTNYLVAISLRL